MVRVKVVAVRKNVRRPFAASLALMATSDSLSISGPKLRIQTENLDKGSYLTTQQHSGRPTNIPTIPSVSPGTVEGTSATVQPQRPLRATARSAPDEIQKLLGQLLYQLEERPKPPPTSDSLKENVTRVTDGRLVAAVGTVVGAIRLQRSILEGQTRNLEADDDADLDDQNQGFTTDTTFSILNQLKDVLSVSFAQGWNLFSAG